MFSAISIKGFIAYDHGEESPTYELIEAAEPRPMKDALIEQDMDDIAALCRMYERGDWVTVIACEEDYPLAAIEYGRTHHEKDYWYGVEISDELRRLAK